jgi:hypothetical protein
LRTYFCKCEQPQVRLLPAHQQYPFTRLANNARTCQAAKLFRYLFLHW